MIAVTMNFCLPEHLAGVYREEKTAKTSPSPIPSERTRNVLVFKEVDFSMTQLAQAMCCEWPSDSCAHTKAGLIHSALLSLSWTLMDANSSGRPGQPEQMCPVVAVKLGVTG